MPPVLDSEIVVIGSGPGGAITACLLAEAGREVTLVESGPFLTLEECPQFTRDEMERKYRNGGVTAALGRTKVAYVEANCVGGGSEINAGLYHRTPEDILDAWRRDYQLEGAGWSDMVPHFEACERDVSISYLPGEAPAASLKLHEGAGIKGWKSLEVPRWFKYGSRGAGEKQSMSRTFIPRALAAGCRAGAECPRPPAQARAGGAGSSMPSARCRTAKDPAQAALQVAVRVLRRHPDAGAASGERDRAATRAARCACTRP